VLSIQLKLAKSVSLNVILILQKNKSINEKIGAER